MKRLIGVMVALIPLSVATGAWAEPGNSGARELGTHEVGTDSMIMQDTERMTDVSDRVNRGDAENTENSSQASTDQQRSDQPDILPEGMVVESSRFGGVTLGVEF